MNDPAKKPESLRNRLTRALSPIVLQFQPARKYLGFVDERSTQHVGGWLHNRLDPSERVQFEVVQRKPGGEKILGHGVANNFYTALAQQNIGDACYGFQFLFPEPLSEAERDNVFVRPARSRAAVKLSPKLITSFELISYIAMDIVNNCNLRCPFCLFDYGKTKTTRFMSDETFDRALKLLPSVRDAGFWLSCLHEPSLHPNFLPMIERIPRQWRQKVMFTTNLAKRMPDAYFAFLADCDFYHINISIESQDPATFEKFRKGARWPIFKENWDRMITAWKAAPKPPRIRYIMMAYKSNLAEIPSLIKYLRDERCAWQVEIRYTYDMDHIPLAFRDAEYLDEADWDWLAEQVAPYSNEEILFIRPLKPLEADTAITTAAPQDPGFVEPLVPADQEIATEIAEPGADLAPVSINPPEASLAAAPEPARAPAKIKNPIPLPLNIQIEWNGDMIICGRWSHPSERRLIEVANINNLENPYPYLAELAERPLQMIQGYVDEISETIVTGWIRDAYDAAIRVEFDVAVVTPDETRLLAHGQADAFWPSLRDSGFGDGCYGFRVELPPGLTVEDRLNMVVRPAHTKEPLERAPRFQGFVDERSIHHAAGWVRNRFEPTERVPVEAILIGEDKSEQIVARGLTDLFYAPLAPQFGGECVHGFRLVFDAKLSESERDRVIVRPVGDRVAIELSPYLSNAYQHVPGLAVTEPV